MVRRLRPRRIVEVGSGHSTRFMTRALRDGSIDAEVTCIDPSPRAALSGLAVRHLPTLVQDADDEAFSALADGDILFVDFEPRGDAGQRCGPSAEPSAAAPCQRRRRSRPRRPAARPLSGKLGWRGYNEQLLVAALLQGGSVEPLFASHYVVTRMAERLDASVIASLPLIAGAFETSLWLRKTAR